MEKNSQYIRDKIIEKERSLPSQKHILSSNKNSFLTNPSWNDFESLLGMKSNNFISSFTTIDDLLNRDEQREKDGFPRKVKVGKIAKPGKDGKVVVVPVVTEEKFYHSSPQPEMGGAGEGEEGDVVGEESMEGEEGGEGGEGGEGDGDNHEIESNAYDLGKVLSEKFELPNLQDKGKKPSLTKFKYELTDINQRTGQLLDKKRTLRRIVKTNILLGRVSSDKPIDTSKFLIDPKDHTYRILAREKEFESQAMIFFLRDYSGSMQGDPTKVVVDQHLMIYTWLIYQYKSNVETRFIVHDTEAKEVPNFHRYYNISTAGGTQVVSAYKLVNKIVEEENLAKDYNIYIFHGTDGDDWSEDGKEPVAEIKKMLTYSNRVGITIAENDWRGNALGSTEVQKYIESSKLLEEKPDLLKLYSLMAKNASQDELIKGLRHIISP